METGKTGSTNRLSFPEARKLVETAAPKVVGKTYAAVAATPKPITKSIAVNTELTWHSDDAKYRKLSDMAKTDKQVQKNKRTKQIFRTMNCKMCVWTLKIQEMGRALVSPKQ